MTVAESAGRVGAVAYVAKMVTVVGAVTVAGAVYNPVAEIVPVELGSIDQE